MFTLSLAQHAHTALLGQHLAQLCVQHKKLRCLMLHGALGCGKTTLTQSIVAHLPQGNVAEVSSPSFTLCNMYPTQPPVLHCDIFRCHSALPEDIWDALDTPTPHTPLIIIEWAQYLPPEALPHEYLDIIWNMCKDVRTVSIVPHGVYAHNALNELQQKN